MANDVENEARTRKRGRWLCRAGWATFALSLALPAINVFGWVPGWVCLWSVYQYVWAILTGIDGLVRGGLANYYTGLAVTNTLFLATPLLHRLFRGDLRRLRRLAFIMGGATVYTWVYLGMVLWDGVGALGSFHAGFYAWLISFALVTAGTLQLSKKRTTSVINQQPTSFVRTEEEMAAVRELEDYLHGVVRPAMPRQDDDNQDTIQAGILSRIRRTRRPWAHTRAVRA